MWWLAVAEAKKPPAPKPEPDAVAVRAPSPPAPGADAGFAALVLPPLAGPTEIPNFQGLSRDTATFTLDADLSVLGSLDAAGVNALFAWFAASPDWRVGRDAGGRVAWRRTGEEGPLGWTLGPERCSYAAVREGSDPRFASGASVATVAAGAPIKVKAFRPAGGLCASFATAVRITGAVEVDLFESAGADGRPFLLAQTTELQRAATTARTLAPTLAARGHDPLGDPAGPKDEVTRVVAGPVPGTLRATARVSAGAPAWVWLRVLDAAGAPWSEATVAAGTLERAGWSADPAVGFAVGSVFAASPGPAFEGTAEWWAVGDDGAVRRLHAAPVVIPAR